MITALIILSLLIISIYVGVMIKKEGIPYSISATYYSLKHKFMFGFTMISTAAFLMPSILEKTPEQYQFLAFLALVGMFIVGLSPNFNDKSEKLEQTLHTIGAIMSLIFSQLWVLCLSPGFLLIWLLYLAYTIVVLKKNWTGNFKRDFIETKPMFWIEIAAFGATYFSLFFI